MSTATTLSSHLATTTNWSQDFTPTPDFAQALHCLENTTRNVLLTGKAGTGKSTFLDYFRKNTKKKIAILAPTGVAALNVQGQTIHSFFGLKPTFLDPTKKHTPRSKAMIKALDILVIDEISMVRADVFDAIAAMLKEFGKKPREPYGGVQLCLIGDLFQLPPIVSRNDQEFFPHFYEGAFFFHGKHYQDALFEKIHFNTVFRQQETEFLDILNNIRSGDVGHTALDALNKRCVNSTSKTEEGTITLTTRAAQADDINQRCLNALGGVSKTYEGKAKGVFSGENAAVPAPLNLTLKIGAQVMFTKNDGTTRRWVNGTLGIVRGMGKDFVSVEVQEGGKARVYDVEAETWKTEKYTLSNGALQKEETGSFTQLPLLLAWAITIHKSQGKTLEKVVIDLGSGAFAAGQLYVALSRCKTLDGIKLTKPVQLRDVSVDRSVVRFLAGDLYQFTLKTKGTGPLPSQGIRPE
jgi:hypothetical protein